MEISSAVPPLKKNSFIRVITHKKSASRNTTSHQIKTKRGEHGSNEQYNLMVQIFLYKKLTIPLSYVGVAGSTVPCLMSRIQFCHRNKESTPLHWISPFKDSVVNPIAVVLDMSGFYWGGLRHIP